jgi:NAD(P)-dependent dehydrogenase (short-subunit alcohol dehydrogenase family)
VDLRGKTALVTGGAVRIGRAICEALAEKGCRVVIHYNRSRSEAAGLAAELERTGVESFTVRGTLDSQRGCERVIGQATKQAGGLDILVNNASVFHKDDLLSVTEEKIRRELMVNAIAPMLLTRAFAAGAGEAAAGTGITHKVINLLDRRITADEPGCLPYLLSKKLLAEFTRTAALDLAPGMTVNGVAPGAVLPPPGEGEEYIRDMAGSAPLEHRCTPRNVAEAVVFLLEADAITGQVIFVDAGQNLLGNG